MYTQRIATLTFLTLSFIASAPLAHEGHGINHETVATEIESVNSQEAGLPVIENGNAMPVTGAGKYVFRHRPLEIPAAMSKHLAGAHGGFAHDSIATGGDGSTYFSLRSVGLLKLNASLSKIEVIGGDEAFTKVNLHNTSLFREAGIPYLALPSDEAQLAYLTTLEGQLLRTFPNPYGESGEVFRVCDLEYVGGTLFAVNGYGDNVCFATRPLHGSAAAPTVGVWEPLRFGGSGTEHGRFGTAHGITRFPNTNTFTIADRANARLESYSPDGSYIGGIKLPEGSMPCDVDYYRNLTLVGCLKGAGGSTPAPIYLLEDGNLVAELNVGRDLGLAGFTHIHNAAFHIVKQRDGSEKLFVLAYSWNPGNFAILEHVGG
ncbi:MAG: hypothetical protein ACI8TQ_000421 [Planctomycetota bacterium]|jgi:hypothetical protein